MATFQLLDQVGGAFRLGRHQLHDPMSRGFPASALLPDPARVPATVMHEQHVPPFDQGRLGSCTANAALGLLVSGIFWRGHAYTEADAVLTESSSTSSKPASTTGRSPAAIRRPIPVQPACGP